MPTATEALVGGDRVVSAPLEEAILERYEDPEWHTLRLFGRGRHPHAFAAGVESHDSL
jgi:hypothetical protein